MGLMVEFLVTMGWISIVGVATVSLSMYIMSLPVLLHCWLPVGDLIETSGERTHVCELLRFTTCRPYRGERWTKVNKDEVCCILLVHHTASHGKGRSHRRHHMMESKGVFKPGTRATLTITSYVIITI